MFKLYHKDLKSLSLQINLEIWHNFNKDQDKNKLLLEEKSMEKKLWLIVMLWDSQLLIKVITKKALLMLKGIKIYILKKDKIEIKFCNKFIKNVN